MKEKAPWEYDAIIRSYIYLKHFTDISKLSNYYNRNLQEIVDEHEKNLYTRTYSNRL